MREYEDVRAAARQTVISMQQDPVMAEDFGAQPTTPQDACLEGVRASDLYVGIFGNRYGYEAKSTLSATEEEFQEAERLGKPILCFVQEGDKEPKQEQFLQRIKNFDEGYQVSFFTNAEDLKLKLVLAISQELLRTERPSTDIAMAIAHMERHQWGSHLRPQHSTAVGIVTFPTNLHDDYMSVLELSKTVYQERLQQAAQFGSTTVLRKDLGVKVELGNNHVRLLQGERYGEAVARLAVFTNGTLEFTQSLDRGRSFDLAAIHVINEDEVSRTLENFFSFAYWFYKDSASKTRNSHFYTGVSLAGIQHQAFGRRPSHPVNSMTVPSHHLDDPLHIPDKPKTVSLSDLSEPTALATLMSENIAHRFKVEGAYYTPGRERR